MCGGFSIFNLVDEKLEATHYSIDSVLPQKLYNARPGMYLPVVIDTDTSGWRVERALWGIATKFTKQPLFNAKSETLFTSSFWKQHAGNRCLVPANGFFEWKLLAGKRSPFYFRVKNRKMFYMAGIFTERNHDGYHFRDFAILTTEPNRLVAAVHNRMPMILDGRAASTWLASGSKPSDLEPLLKPYDPDKMTSYRVTRDVNNARNNSEELIYPLP